MTQHWWHVAISHALVLGSFAVLIIGAARRHRAARARLAALDPRA